MIDFLIDSISSIIGSSQSSEDKIICIQKIFKMLKEQADLIQKQNAGLSKMGQKPILYEKRYPIDPDTIIKTSLKHNSKRLLNRALDHEDEKVAELLIQNGAIFPHDLVMLAHACKKGQVAKVRMLLRYGANPFLTYQDDGFPYFEIRERWSNTCLYYAVRKNAYWWLNGRGKALFDDEVIIKLIIELLAAGSDPVDAMKNRMFSTDVSDPTIIKILKNSPSYIFWWTYHYFVENVSSFGSTSSTDLFNKRADKHDRLSDFILLLDCLQRSKTKEEMKMAVEAHINQFPFDDSKKYKIRRNELLKLNSKTLLVGYELFRLGLNKLLDFRNIAKEELCNPSGVFTHDSDDSGDSDLDLSVEEFEKMIDLKKFRKGYLLPADLIVRSLNSIKKVEFKDAHNKDCKKESKQEPPELKVSEKEIYDLLTAARYVKDCEESKRETVVPTDEDFGVELQTLGGEKTDSEPKFATIKRLGQQ